MELGIGQHSTGNAPSTLRGLRYVTVDCVCRRFEGTFFSVRVEAELESFEVR
jgi:hypothetical protein